ncbi:MAG: SDR family NAD(P)-dependent oxidoreductase [Chloroflexaceae bacterium]|nr:SDR family NAD(P)-dependent oxidoreductase [Chloroflexaceae bacterium]
MTTTPRTVVISGAARGIGRAAALHLDQLGWQVFAGVRQPDHAAALRAVASPRMVPVQCDLTDYASLHHAAAVVAQHLDGRGLDGLINNAGIVIPGPLEYLPLDDLHTQLAVGLVGQLALTQQMLPLLRPRRGRIINISSGSGRLVRPLLAAYSAAKFGLEALSDGLRLELAPSGIRVIVIQPGATATPRVGRHHRTARCGAGCAARSRPPHLWRGAASVARCADCHGALYHPTRTGCCNNCPCAANAVPACPLHRGARGAGRCPAVVPARPPARPFDADVACCTNRGAGRWFPPAPAYER